MPKTNKKTPPVEAVPGDTLILSTGEAARFLNISPVTLERWRGKKSRLGPAFVRLGLRRVGYRRADLEKWVAQNLSRGSDEAA